MLLQWRDASARRFGRAAARLPKALDPDNCGAGTNRKFLGRLAPRSSTFDLRNHSLPHLPRIGLWHRPASQKRINADSLSHPRPHENPPDSIGAEHALVQLAGKIDWEFIDGEIAPLYSDGGRPGIATQFVIGLFFLKHIYGLSDEGVCERWVYDPYFQHFTGEEFFQHEFPHERSDLSHWRKRLGGKLELLLAESLRVAHESGALRTKDLARGSRSIPPCSP